MFGNLLQMVLIVKARGKKICLPGLWKYQKIRIIQGLSFGLVLIYVIVRGGQRDLLAGSWVFHVVFSSKRLQPEDRFIQGLPIMVAGNWLGHENGFHILRMDSAFSS
jgi:formate/nitrite transporter FocA (FNT family)